VQFDRAVALLHSFWYAEAAKAFTTITEADATCAMGYWGLAMSVWYPPLSAAGRPRTGCGATLRQDRSISAACSAHAVAYLYASGAMARIYRVESKFCNRSQGA
jgi:hypothetical protein